MGDWEGLDIADWEEFEERLQRLNELQANVLREHGGKSSTMLFRGQKDADWDLVTSLERECKRAITLDEYFRAVTTIQPEIESQTEERWATASDYFGYKSWLQSLDQGAITPVLLDLPGYEYLTYLRHHGFPSPLLDWTRSPYIAAYFAFTDATAASGGRISIYVYWNILSLQGICPPDPQSSRPLICTKGHHVRAHRRHLSQQSQYTYCVQLIDGAWQFASHNGALSRCDSMEGSDLRTLLSEGPQGLAWKFNLPTSEKGKALKSLGERNIDGLSLFGIKDDATSDFMKTLAIREMHLESRGCPPASKFGAGGTAWD